MDFGEKADIRLNHWLKHNETHIAEYEAFVEELEKEGWHACADQIRELITFSRKGNDCLRKAIEVL
ncbi:MAG: hypothetical protein R6U50_02370 [Desulfobacterales bacterium]